MTKAIEKIVKKFGSALLTKQNPENPAHALTLALNNNGAKLFIYIPITFYKGLLLLFIQFHEQFAFAAYMYINEIES